MCIKIQYNVYFANAGRSSRERPDRKNLCKMHKAERDFLSAVCQAHFAPSKNADLCVRASYFQRLAFCVYAVRFVDVVDPFAVPNSAFAAVSAYRFDCCFWSFAFNTFRGDLPSAFVCDRFSVAQGESVIVAQFSDRSYIDHLSLPPGGLFSPPLFHFFEREFDGDVQHQSVQRLACGDCFLRACDHFFVSHFLFPLFLPFCDYSIPQN